MSPTSGGHAWGTVKVFAEVWALILSSFLHFFPTWGKSQLILSAVKRRQCLLSELQRAKMGTEDISSFLLPGHIGASVRPPTAGGPRPPRPHRPPSREITLGTLDTYLTVKRTSERRPPGRGRGSHTRPPSWGVTDCLLYTSPSPRDLSTSRMPSSA